MTFRHEIRVRYSEVDIQRVVFNSHYLAWCDDASDLWFRSLGAGLEDDWWEVMVKRAEIVWEGGATIGDTVAIDISVTRWGTTSFDVLFHGTVRGAHVFDATITYVAVRTGTKETVRVPDDFRTAAGSTTPP